MKLTKSRIILLIGTVIVLWGVFHAPHEKKSQTAQQTLKLISRPLESTLFYSGIVQPLTTRVLTSPAEGVIQDMFFHYGEVVKKGDVLFTISSEKFQTDYKNALMQYVKSKNDFNNSQTQMSEGEFLHQNQLISDDDYKNKKSAYYTSQLALIQAKEALNNMLKQLTVQGFKLDELTIENIDKITTALNSQGDAQKLKVIAPVSGVLLLPAKSETESETKKIGKGDQIKQGDVLAVIGDTKGLTIHVTVNEFNINQVKLGQAVKVTGAAFPGETLIGKISGIDKQAQINSGGMPVFPIEVTVPSLTKDQQSIIHVGMSSKVEITIQGDPQISIPLKAVFEKNGRTYVKTENPKNGKIHEVLVRTGETTPDSVTIESGLKEGDQIVFTR